MPGNDLNWNLPVGITNNTGKTVKEIDRDFDGLRRSIGRPMRSALDLDTTAVEQASRSVDALRANLSRPLRLAPIQGGERAWSRSRRGMIPSLPSGMDGGPLDEERDALRNRGVINQSAKWPEIPFRDDPIGLKSNRGKDRTPEEQQIRDAAAGIIRGMKQRAEVEQKLADQARIELKARELLGLSNSSGRDIAVKDVALGDVNGPAARPRFDSEESAIRAKQAQIIKAMDAEAKARQELAIDQNRELEARKRLGLKTPRTVADASPATLERLNNRQREQGALSRGSDALSAAESNYSVSRYRSVGDNARRRAAGLGNRGFGGGRGSGNLAANEVGLGGDSLVNLEDKVQLGGGAKLLGGAARIAGGAAAGLAIAGELGDQLKAYKDRLAQGASGRDAFVLGLKDLGDKLPIIGGILNGLGNLGAELSGEADKDRKRAKNDQIAADNDAVSQRRQRIVENGRVLREGLAGQAFGADAALRIGNANRIDETGRLAAQEQAKIDNESRQRDLNAQAAEIERRSRLKQSDAGYLSGDDRQAGMDKIASLRKASAEKLEQDLSKIRVDYAKQETEQRKQVEADTFAIRQSYLQKEGQAVTANLEAADHEAEQARIAAQERADKAIAGAGGDKNLIANTQDTLAKQLKAIDDRRNVTRSAIIEQAGRDNKGTLAGELQQRAALGDVNAAIEASKLVIDKQTEERRKQLVAIVAQSQTNSASAKKAQEQLDTFDQSVAAQKKAAEEQIKAQEQHRRLGVFGDVNSGRVAEMRRRAGLGVGNAGLSLQADAYDIISQSQQRDAELRSRLADPSLKADERDAINDELKALPGRLSQSIEDLTRTKVTAADFSNAALASAQDAGGLTGLAVNAKENVQARLAKTADDTLAVLKKMLEAITSGGGQPLVVPYT
ncbi:MAG: hypothetical protein QM754_18570 [Tepidisphaeraceae bacterium]